MNTISRRHFLAASALTLAATRLRAEGSVPVTLAMPGEAAGAQMPADFIGLSYEIQQLTEPSFFSTANTALIREFKALATGGVLRLGGNTSEFAWWKPEAGSPEPEHPHTREVEGEPKAQYYPVTAEAVRNLAGFLDATGWRCIYGINMGTNTPERAAAEAGFVAKTLGARLEYFQIGNEADLYGKHLRDPQTWGPKAYLDEWLKLARAVEARVPGAKFGMPDVAGDIEWLTGVADAWASVENPPHVAALTHHYYFGGPATNPDVNIPNLLKAATVARTQKTADTANAAAKKMGVTVRMSEGNTCYRGGKPGVSDVTAAALWAADYSLLLASNGYTGVNLHGGSYKAVAGSVGGSLPGDQLLKDQGATPEQIAARPHPFYTPIAEFGHEFARQPVGYGLKFATAFLGGAFLKGDFSAKLQAAGVNATAYAVKQPDGKTVLAVLNKDDGRDLELTVDFGTKKAAVVEAEQLTAPALDSREVSLKRAPRSGYAKNGKIVVSVPRGSAIRLTVA